MSERSTDRKFTRSVFGTDLSVPNLATKSAASIYHAIFLHSEGKIDSELSEGIRKNALRFLTDLDIKKIKQAHEQSGKHTL